MFSLGFAARSRKSITTLNSEDGPSGLDTPNIVPVIYLIHSPCELILRSLIDSNLDAIFTLGIITQPRRPQTYCTVQLFLNTYLVPVIGVVDGQLIKLDTVSHSFVGVMFIYSLLAPPPVPSPPLIPRPGP